MLPVVLRAVLFCTVGLSELCGAALKEFDQYWWEKNSFQVSLGGKNFPTEWTSCLPLVFYSEPFTSVLRPLPSSGLGFHSMHIITPSRRQYRSMLLKHLLIYFKSSHLDNICIWFVNLSIMMQHENDNKKSIFNKFTLVLKWELFLLKHAFHRKAKIMRK